MRLYDVDRCDGVLGRAVRTLLAPHCQRGVDCNVGKEVAVATDDLGGHGRAGRSHEQVPAGERIDSMVFPRCQRPLVACAPTTRNIEAAPEAGIRPRATPPPQGRGGRTGTAHAHRHSLFDRLRRIYPTGEGRAENAGGAQPRPVSARLGQPGSGRRHAAHVTQADGHAHAPLRPVRGHREVRLDVLDGLLHREPVARHDGRRVHTRAHEVVRAPEQLRCNDHDGRGSVADL